MLWSGTVWRFVHGLCALLVLACTSDDDASATPGTEGASCSQSGRCGEGLSCFSNVCIRVESSGGGQTGNTSSGGEPAGGAPSPEGPCAVGDVISCSCADGSNGFQLCDAEGQQFRPCQCGDAGVVGPVGGGGGVALDAGSGGGSDGAFVTGGTSGRGGTGGTGGAGVCSPSSAPTECDACLQENCCDAWLECGVDPACGGDGTIRNPGEVRCTSDCSLAILESVGAVELNDVVGCLGQCATGGQFTPVTMAVLECSLFSTSSSQLGVCAVACFGLETP